MTNITVPPLPVSRFAAFKEFYERDPMPELWIYGDEDYPWTWEDAGRTAANLWFALGEPSIIGGREGDDALQRWLAIFNTPLWCDISQKMIAGPGVTGDGPRFLSPTSTNIRRLDIERLNAWCLHWLKAFYAHDGPAPAEGQTDPAPQSNPTLRVEQIEAAPVTKRKRPKLEPLIAAIRKGLPSDKAQAIEQLRAVKKEEFYVSYKDYCKSPDTFWRARNELLGELLRELELDR